MKKMYLLFTMLLVASMMLAGCGTKVTPTTAPVADTPVPVVPTDTPVPFRVGFVSDTGGVFDGSFNEAQWNGLQQAQTELGAQVQFIQSDEASQYTPNLTEFATQGYDVIVASGFFLGADLASVAVQYPNIKFAIFDYAYPDPSLPADNPGNAACVPNVMGIVFKTDQAAYLAGYVSAGMAIQIDPTSRIVAMSFCEPRSW